MGYGGRIDYVVNVARAADGNLFRLPNQFARGALLPAPSLERFIRIHFEGPWHLALDVFRGPLSQLRSLKMCEYEKLRRNAGKRDGHAVIGEAAR